MLEWIASVRMATEPVTVPATTLSRISTEFEITDSVAARCFCWEPTALISVSALEPFHELTGGTPAVTDRILLGLVELGHRAVIVEIVRHKRRVIAETPGASRGIGQRPAAFPEEHLLGAGVRVHVGQRTHVSQ